MNQDLSPSPPNVETESRGEELDEVKERLGQVVFRIMNLEDHSGVIAKEGDRVTYVVDSKQYPDQGDHAYETFEAAVDRAFPHSLDKVHAVSVSPADVVQVDPENSPGHVYIKNASQVEAVKVPPGRVEEHIANVGSGREDPDLTKKVIEQLFPSENNN